jgi:prepilin-type N-terminal cleavage/methylation domain-containing protein
MTMRNARSGFSLIELVVVMTLLAVMAMTVTPVFRGSLAGARADHAARDLFAEFVAAQERAVTHAVEYRVYLDQRKNSYWVAHAPFVSKNEYGTIATMQGDVVVVPDRLKISKVSGRSAGGGRYYLAFYPHGGTDVGELLLVDAFDSRSVYRIETTGTRVEFHQPD